MTFVLPYWEGGEGVGQGHLVAFLTCSCPRRGIIKIGSVTLCPPFLETTVLEECIFLQRLGFFHLPSFSKVTGKAKTFATLWWWRQKSELINWTPCKSISNGSWNQYNVTAFYIYFTSIFTPIFMLIFYALI